MMQSYIDPNLRALCDEHGVVLRNPKLCAGSMRHRMAKLGLRNQAEYAQFILEHPEEVPLFLQAVSPNITRWWRDAPTWAHVAKLCDSWRETAPIERVVWSAACSTGEEAYSLAITALIRKAPVKIIATDFDEQALLVAQRGLYAARDIESKITRDKFKVYFAPVASGAYTARMVEVNKNVRDVVQFERCDLKGLDWPVRSADLVFMRNVLQYFTPVDCYHTVRRVHGVLRNLGYLYVGVAEDKYITHGGFKKVSKGIYQKTGE